MVHSSTTLDPELEEPIRAELFGAERLEQHAESLAAAQIITGDLRRGRLLTPRVLENGRVLVDSYRPSPAQFEKRKQLPCGRMVGRQLSHRGRAASRDHRRLATWVLQAITQTCIRPPPELSTGIWSCLGICRAHGQSLRPRHAAPLCGGLSAVQPLTIGELWAVAISLRIVLVENLRRLAERIVHSRAARREADELADGLLGTGPLAVESTATALRGLENRPLATAFAVQLVQRLRDLDPKVRPVLLWLDERLAAQGTTANDIVQAEHQQQAAMSVTVRNIITSMRLTSAFDWAVFFETVSPVDKILQYNPRYAEMDFVTRDTYRHAIEDLSRGTGLRDRRDRTSRDRARRAVVERMR